MLRNTLKLRGRHSEARRTGIQVEGDGREQIVLARAGGAVNGSSDDVGPRLAVVRQSGPGKLALSTFASMDGMAQRCVLR